MSDEKKNANPNETRRPRGGPMGGGPGGPGERDDEKPEDFKKAWGKLLRYCKRYALPAIVAFAAAAAGSILQLLSPDQLSKITDEIMRGAMAAAQGLGGVDMGKIAAVCYYLIFLYVLGAALTFAQGWIMTTLTQRLSFGLRRDIDVKINRLPLKYYDTATNGDILSCVTNDVDTISQSLNQSLGGLVSGVTMFLGAIVMMFITNAVMAAAAIGATVVGFLVMVLIVVHSQKYFRRNQNYLGELNGHVEEIYGGHTIVRAYNAEGAAREKFRELNDQLRDNNWKSQFFSGLMMPLMMFIGNFGYAVVCVVGAALVMNGTIGFGVIVAFMIYIRLFTQPLQQIAQAVTSMQSAAAAAERVFAFAEAEELADEREKTRTLPVSDARGDVTFEHVRFGYDADAAVIRDFSAEIKAGQKVAIVGPTGAGKTTIVNLLMRFYETQGGRILIDGVPASELTRANVHDLFCMVLQDTWLFEGTIRENIVYSKANVSDDAVRAACRAVGLDHFIGTLPRGYDTELGDNASLSAGQRQLLTIARAMVENAPLLILDEATSSVDTRTELLVQQAMDRLTEGRTSFVIAHRLSTIRNADLILVMRDGDIVESGRHEELLAQGGFYAELYNSQFEDAEVA